LRRLASLGLALAAACGSQAGLEAGPLDKMHMPTGLAVLDHRVLVASSNSDLFYDTDTGGAILSLDPTSLDTVRVTSAMNVRSFAGELAVGRAVDPTVGDPAGDRCGVAAGGGRGLTSDVAVFATRGSNTLNVLDVDPSGRLHCRFCDIPSSGNYADPFAVTMACAPGNPRAFVGYLGAVSSVGWLSQLDLDTGRVRTANVGVGVVRSLAYDAAHERLFVAQLATSQPTPLRWVELGGCTFGITTAGISCSVYSASIPGLPVGSEIRSIALAHPFPGAPQRAYVTVRLYDVTAAQLQGARTVDYGGLLVVLDLVEDAQGVVTPTTVRIVPESGTLGRGLQDVRVLPARAGRRDALAAVASDDGFLWLYDDDSGALTLFQRGRDLVTGAPQLGRVLSGLAVDPELSGTTARLWVGSYQDSYVTPVDVPLDDPGAATYAPDGTRRRISGGKP
jgi:hypothetical protein